MSEANEEALAALRADVQRIIGFILFRLSRYLEYQSPEGLAILRDAKSRLSAARIALAKAEDRL